MKILIIDDNKDITDAMSLYAESQGISCEVANDGKKGIDLLKKENFDLVLLDIAMPDFSGYDVIDSIKNEETFDLKKIVIITASSLDDATIAKVESLGIYSVVRKPISIDRLQEIIDKFQ